MQIGDSVVLMEGHKQQGEIGKIESVTQTGSVVVRLSNGQVCSSYPEFIEVINDNISNNSETMNTSEEIKDIAGSIGFKIVIGLIILFIAFFYFKGNKTEVNTTNTPSIDQKIQFISEKEIEKGNEYKIQKEAREKKREQIKIEKESVSRVEKINVDIEKTRKELYEIIK